MTFYSSVTKGLELKVRKFQGIIPTFGEVAGKKLEDEGFLPPSTSILNSILIRKKARIFYVQSSLVSSRSLTKKEH